MNKGKSRIKILQRLANLEMVAPSNEPYMAFIEQIGTDEWQVTEQYQKKHHRIDCKTLKVKHPDEYALMNPKTRCFIDDLEFDAEDISDMFICLVKIVNESELETLVDLMVKAIQSEHEIHTELNMIIKSLIKIYKAQIPYIADIDVVDFSRLTSEQLRKIIKGDNEKLNERW